MATKMGELKCQINMTSIVPRKLLGLQNGKIFLIMNLVKRVKEIIETNLNKHYLQRKSIKDISIKEIIEVQYGDKRTLILASFT